MLGARMATERRPRFQFSAGRMLVLVTLVCAGLALVTQVTVTVLVSGAFAAAGLCWCTFAYRKDLDYPSEWSLLELMFAICYTALALLVTLAIAASIYLATP